MDIDVYLQPSKLSVVMLEFQGIYPLLISFQWLNGLCVGLYQESANTLSGNNFKILCAFLSDFLNSRTTPKPHYRCSCSMSPVPSSENCVSSRFMYQHFFPEGKSWHRDSV